MKRKWILVLVLALSLLMLAGCQCKHEWADANCTTPKTCTLCQETEGAPLGHSWLAATCTAPKTCENCGETNGEPLPHTFAEATCTTAKTCTECGVTEGEPLPHTFVDATYETPKTCSVCQATEGTVLVRPDLGMSNDDLLQAINASLNTLGYQLEYYGTDDDGWSIYDVNESASGEYTNVYIALEPNPNGGNPISIYICSEDVNDDNANNLMGSVGAVSLLVVEPEYDFDALATGLLGAPQIRDNVAYYYVEQMGLVVDMQVNVEYGIFWIYPAEN